MLFHCCIELDTLLKMTLAGEKILNIGETETYDLVRGLKEKGYRYFSACDNVDSEGRCVGHEILLGVMR